MVRQVDLVIPLRDVAHVEKAESCPNGNTIDQALRFVMQRKNESNLSLKEFIFAQLPDRNFVIDKIAELLMCSSTPEPFQNYSTNENEKEEFESNCKLQQPLMTIYQASSYYIAKSARVSFFVLNVLNRTGEKSRENNR